MKNETISKTTELKFVPTHQNKDGLVTGELRTGGILSQFICNIEESSAKEIIKRNNMHDELIDKLKELSDAVSFLESVDARTAEANMQANNLLKQAQRK